MTQSAKPPRPALLALLAVAALFAIIWGAIALATAGTAEDTCQTKATSQPYNGEKIPASRDKCQ